MSEVYLPIAVEVFAEDGKVKIGKISIDFDAAPWMNVDKEPNVWTGEEWVQDREAEETAIENVGRILSALDPDATPRMLEAALYVARYGEPFGEITMEGR